MKKSVWMSSVLVSSIGLAACQPTHTNQQTTQQSSPSASAALQATNTQAASVTIASATTIHSAQDNTQDSAPTQINWALVDSGVKAVDKSSFNYPFALNSEPVKAYAEMYHVDNQTSRYNLTVGMAVNEVLSKVLDQIGTAYVSHELTAGKDSAFIIHTTKQIAPSEHTYVFAEPFAKGLTIPVKIINDGKK